MARFFKPVKAGPSANKKSDPAKEQKDVSSVQNKPEKPENAPQK